MTLCARQFAAAARRGARQECGELVEDGASSLTSIRTCPPLVMLSSSSSASASEKEVSTATFIAVSRPLLARAKRMICFSRLAGVGGASAV